MTMDRFQSYFSKPEAVQLLGIIFVIYAVAGSHDLYSLAYLLTLAAAFIYGYLSPDLDRLLRWISLLFMANILLVFTPWFPNGLFGNPNYFGAAMVMGIAISISYKNYESVIPFLFGLYLSQSRGATFAAGVVFLIAIWRVSKPTALTLFAIALAAVFWFSSGERGLLTLTARMGIWQDTLNHLNLWGHGFGSFLAEYSQWPIRRNMTLELAPHAYNDFLELIFELGLGAIPLWLMAVLSFESPRREPRLILWAYFALSLSHFPLYLPGIGHVAILSLGHLAAGRQPQRKLKWLAGS